MPALRPSGDAFFGNPRGQRWSFDQHQAHRDIERALKDLYIVVRGLLSAIRKNYVEIDLKEINSVAWNRYTEHENQTRSLQEV